MEKEASVAKVDTKAGMGGWVAGWRTEVCPCRDHSGHVL